MNTTMETSIERDPTSASIECQGLYDEAIARGEGPNVAIATFILWNRARIIEAMRNHWVADMVVFYNVRAGRYYQSATAAFGVTEPNELLKEVNLPEIDLPLIWTSGDGPFVIEGKMDHTVPTFAKHLVMTQLSEHTKGLGGDGQVSFNGKTDQIKLSLNKRFVRHVEDSVLIQDRY
jgi:hypothetical protein